MEFLGILLVFIIDMSFFVPGYVKRKFDGTPKREKLVWKGICIGVPLIVMLTGVLLYRGTPITYLVALGLLLCALADIILEIHFSIGGFLFGFGHLSYIGAMILANGQVQMLSLLIYMPLFIVGTILLARYFHKERSKMLLMILYNTVISATFALAVPLLFLENKSFFSAGLGACSLVISDWLLARNMVVTNNNRRAMITLVFYFGGQMLISLVSWM